MSVGNSATQGSIGGRKGSLAITRKDLAKIRELTGYQSNFGPPPTPPRPDRVEPRRPLLQELCVASLPRTKGTVCSLSKR